MSTKSEEKKNANDPAFQPIFYYKDNEVKKYHSFGQM